MNVWIGPQRGNSYFSKSQVAASLWDYGEDDLADLALEMADEDLGRVQTIAAHYEHPSYPLPIRGQRITHNHVTAFAAITFFEGKIRPLKRIRRRNIRERPPDSPPICPTLQVVSEPLTRTEPGVPFYAAGRAAVSGPRLRRRGRPGSA